MIDLSFLTEEEQEAIMKVLNRDADLKKAEEARIRHLEETVEDDSTLKNMSGQWFYEAKSKRHRDKIHGADLIRASIRKKKPQTLAELIQSNAEKSKKSWVNNVNKDIFVPPELFGVMEEPEKEEEEEQKQNKSYQSFDENSTPSEVWHLQSAPKTNSLAIDKPEETFNIASSPAKQRKNPFNDSALLEENLALKTENQISENGTAHLYETPDRNTLSPSVENVSRKNLQNSESKESKKNSREVANGTQRSTGQPPIPKARTLTYQIGDAQSDSDSTFSKSAKRNDLNNSTGTRKGILKRNSSSSSTDSEILRIGQNFDSQNKNAPPTSPILEGVIEKNSIAEQSEESAQNALDRLKHVRFSSNVSQKAQTPELHRGKELGEYDLLESDLTKNGLDGFNESQKGPRVSESALVSQSSSSTDMPEAGHGLPKPMLPSQSRSSAVESVVNISEEESRFSKHSSERDPKSVSNVPQDSSFSKHATPSESHSSTKDTRSTTDVSQQKHSPSRPYNTNRSHPSIEVSQQEKSPPTEIVSERTNFNQISSNLNKNKVPRETVPAKEPAQLLNLETQPTKFSIDQQPIYAEIKKSPQVSKPNSADLEQDQQPIYAVIKKSPQVLKPNSTDLQQETETEDKNMQPKYVDQKWENQHSEHRGESLLYGKSKGGGGKTLYDTTNDSVNKLQEATDINRDANLKSLKEGKSKGGATNINSSEDFLKEPKLKNTAKITNNGKTSEDKVGSNDITGHREKQPGTQDQEDRQIGIAKCRNPFISEQNEFMQPLKTMELSQEKGRVSDMKSFWEGEKTTVNRDPNYKEPSSFVKQMPSQENSQDINTNSECFLIESKDPSKNNQVAFQKGELQDDELPSFNVKYLKSMWEKEKREPKLIPDKPRIDYTTDKSGKVMDFTERKPKDFTGLSTTEDLQLKKEFNVTELNKNFENRSESLSPLKNDKTSASQQKANFNILSLKERMDEDSKDHISNPSQFQSLRSFWNAGNKSQDKTNLKSSIAHSPTTFTSINNSIPSNVQTNKELMEAKEKMPENVQTGMEAQDQNQLLNIQERLPKGEKYQRPSRKEAQLDQMVLFESKKREESPSIEPIKTEKKCTTQPKSEVNTDDIGLEKLGPEASETQDPVYSPTSGKGKSNEKDSTQQWHTSENLMQHKQIASSDIHKGVEPSKQEVAETVEKTMNSSKAELNLFNAALEKLQREAAETSPPSNQNILSKEPSQPEQRRFFEKVMERSHNDSSGFQKEKEMHPSEVKETVLKTAVPLKTDLTEFNIRLEKLRKEVPEIPSPSEKGTSENMIQLKDYKKESEHSQETGERTDNTSSPPKTDFSHLDVRLGNLQREASERSSPLDQDTVPELSSVKYSPPEQEQYFEKVTHYSPNYSINFQNKNEVLPQEVNESIEKTIAPPKINFNEFNISLQKLYEEAAKAPSSLHLTASEEHKIQKNVSGQEQESSDDEMTEPSHNFASHAPKGIEHPKEEITETVKKIIAPEKAERSVFNSGLEKLHKDSSGMSPKLDETAANRKDMQANMPAYDEQKVYNEMHFSPSITSQENITENENSRRILHPEETRSSVKRIEFDQKDSMGYQQKKALPQEIKETIQKTVTPNAESSTFKANLEKLCQEAMETASPLYQKTDDGIPPDPSSESQQGPFTHSTMPANLNSSREAQLQFTAPIMKENVKQNDEKIKEQLFASAYGANDMPVSKVPKRNEEILNKSILANVESVGTPLVLEENNEVLDEVREEKKIEHEKTDDSSHGNKQVAGSNGQEHTADANVSSSYATKRTPLRDMASSNKKSTVELYLASPYQEDEDLTKYDDSSLSDGNTGSYATSRRSSSRSEEELNPVLNALKRSTAKSKPSKSLEDIPSVTSNQRKVDIPKEVLSDEDVSTVPSFSNKFSNPENLKRLSQSVPAFLQEESDDRETDSTSESSFQLGRHKKSPSSLTNLSGSSGMASMSSVSGSVMSIYSGDFGNVDIKGNIQFAIDYVEQLKEFHIFVAQCKDLAEADVKKHRSDPYVKSYLLPDKAKMGKRKTTVRKKTLNPAYNDILRYKIDRQTLLTQKLNLSVWHNDTFGRNSFLGEVELDLATWDWNNKQMNWFPLQPRTPAAGLALEHRGEMKLALKYVPQASTGKKSLENGEVHIWVKECRGLPLLRGNRINSFVKCTILPDTSRKSRQKTRSVEKTTNPVFNHTMVYDGFRSEDLSEACIELTVWDHNRLVNHFLGGLRIGLGTGKSYGTLVDWMDSTIDEASLWDRMINTQNAWVEDTLPLRMLMVAKMTK
ncbi:synaptotagmin-like protein 2 isoform X3 [Rhinatrema bivittatum]|uniref:synaptotagmin-like protein 2 isoform X3 n=1 Tax=Rhinatrema bivittatum TaxID=194408 RepID=UPI0011278A49|nr:synaptotagmin-like protein 2 isoform X3 [Rhinatrema bivittatum]